MRRLAATVALAMAGTGAAAAATGDAASPPQAPGGIAVYAAGSLRGAFGEIAAAWQAAHPEAGVRFAFGASGLLGQRLSQGERADVYASADMAHPQALHRAGLAGPVRRFAANSLCVIARPELKATPQTLVGLMLDDGVRLGTSTPGADPSGDYAWEMFRRVERSGVAGAFARLSAKALQLAGGPRSPPPPAGRSVYAALVGDGTADLFVTYCTNAAAARRENPALVAVPVPAAIDVAASYGVVVMKGARPEADAFAGFLLGADAQAILARHGFSAR